MKLNFEITMIDGKVNIERIGAQSMKHGVQLELPVSKDISIGVLVGKDFCVHYGNHYKPDVVNDLSDAELLQKFEKVSSILFGCAVGGFSILA